MDSTEDHGRVRVEAFRDRRQPRRGLAQITAEESDKATQLVQGLRGEEAQLWGLRSCQDRDPGTA